MKAQDLKNSILQLAIQGKLVEQRAEEGTAKELLEKIEAEKKKLIQEGKIKNQKALPAINDEEIPFDIPDSWEWVKLGVIGSWCAGATPSRSNPKYYGGNIPWLKTGDLNDGYITEVPEFISEEALKKTSVRLNPIGSVLMAMYGATIGKLGILNIEATTNQACCACIPYSIIYNKYLFYFLMGQRRVYIKMGAGGAQPNISKEKIVNSIVPLPPLEEQKRIVAKIEELMPYVDKYDVAYSEVEKLNKKFPEDMQKSILQYAIQGKLVAQRKEDGTAEELYQQIQEEKKKLIEEGKIKKTKALPEITEDEIPFDIPENWKWVRLGEIISILGDGIHGTPIYNERGDFYFINGNNLNEGIIEIKDNTKRVDEEQFIKHKRELNENTVLVSINGTIGNVAFYGGEKVILGKSACYFNLIIKDFKYYLYWVIKTKYFLDYAIKRATGTTIKNVSLAAMKEFIVPLPPLEEQKRIVEKIEELLPYAKQLVK